MLLSRLGCLLGLFQSHLSVLIIGLGREVLEIVVVGVVESYRLFETVHVNIRGQSSVNGVVVKQIILFPVGW